MPHNQGSLVMSHLTSFNQLHCITNTLRYFIFRAIMRGVLTLRAVIPAVLPPSRLSSLDIVLSAWQSYLRRKCVVAPLRLPNILRRHPMHRSAVSSFVEFPQRRFPINSLQTCVGRPCRFEIKKWLRATIFQHVTESRFPTSTKTSETNNTRVSLSNLQ